MEICILSNKKVKKIRNLLFDFGNVLIDIDIPGAIQNITELLDDSHGSAFLEKHIWGLAAQYEIDGISTDQFVGGILKYCKEGVNPDDVKVAWNSMLIGIPEYRLTMLERLKENHNVVLLSNTNELHMNWVWDHLLNAHGEENFNRRYFHDTYYSHLIKLRKPDKACFEHVCTESFITPKYTLFIDDLSINIEAAKKLGFQTRLSPPEDEIAEFLKVEGFY